MSGSKTVLLLVLLEGVASYGTAHAKGARGEVQTQSSSAAFDDDSVTGPSVNLARIDATTWRGQLRDRAVEVKVTADGMVGAGTDLHFTRDAEALKVDGYFLRRRLHLKLDPRGASDAYRRMDLRSVFRLEGRAAQPNPPLVQMVFAMVATDGEGVLQEPAFVPPQRTPTASIPPPIEP